MRRSHPQQYLATDHQAIAARAHAEWAELPLQFESMGERLVTAPRDSAAARSESVRRFTTAWANTLPASLDNLPAPEPFREPLRGLAMREVQEPEIFRIFFGPA